MDRHGSSTRLRGEYHRCLVKQGQRAHLGGFVAFSAVLLAASALGGTAMTTHVIFDAKADIKELDVGDLDDMETDVPPMFLDTLKRKKMPMPRLSEMKDPMDWAGSGNGMNMVFATLKQEEAEVLGKEGTDKLASRWKSMLEIAGVNVQAYSVDPGQVLFVANGPGLVSQIREFVLSQPETDWFELQQKRYYPEGRNAPLMDHAERKERQIALGWRKPDPPKEQPKSEKKKRRKPKRDSNL